MHVPVFVCIRIDTHGAAKQYLARAASIQHYYTQGPKRSFFCLAAAGHTFVAVVLECAWVLLVCRAVRASRTRLRGLGCFSTGTQGIKRAGIYLLLHLHASFHFLSSHLVSPHTLFDLSRGRLGPSYCCLRSHVLGCRLRRALACLFWLGVGMSAAWQGWLA
jgi:hypothetical protein